MNDSSFGLNILYILGGSGILTYVIIALITGRLNTGNRFTPKVFTKPHWLYWVCVIFYAGISCFFIYEGAFSFLYDFNQQEKSRLAKLRSRIAKERSAQHPIKHPHPKVTPAPITEPVQLIQSPQLKWQFVDSTSLRKQTIELFLKENKISFASVQDKNVRIEEMDGCMMRQSRARFGTTVRSIARICHLILK